MKRGLIQVAVGLTLSAMLLALLLRSVDLGRVDSAMARLDLRFILLAVCAHMLAMLVRSIVWQRLLAARVSIAVLFKASIVGFAVGYLMRLRIGEVVRAYLLARWRGISYGTTAASLVVERVLDGLAVGALLVLGMATTAHVATWVTALAAFVGVLFGSLTMLLTFATVRTGASTRFATTIATRGPRRFADTLIRHARSFDEGLEPLRSWRRLPALSGLLILGWSLQFAVFYLCMTALGISSTIRASLLTGAVANFATLLPSAPGNAGTFDGAIVKLLSDTLSIGLEQATAYALVVHAIVVIPIITLGGLIVWRSNLGIGQLLGSGRNTRGAPSSSNSIAVAANT